MKKLIIGTRGSPLALRQAQLVSSEIAAYFDGPIELKVIKTTGDAILDAPLAGIGTKGLFVREIERALLEGSIDLAVHSMKDMPAEIPGGLMLSGTLKREDPRDAFVSLKYRSLEELDESAVIATCSLRRKAQLLHYRPGVTVTDIRGNVETRIRKLQGGIADGLIMAAAGLNRMGLSSRITEILHTDIMLPAAGQGALAIETREKDPAIISLVDRISCPDDFAAARAERALMKALNGGCHVPIGALAHLSGDAITLAAIVLSPDGAVVCRDALKGSRGNPEELGNAMARQLIQKGAGKILKGLEKTDGQ